MFSLRKTIILGIIVLLGVFSGWLFWPRNDLTEQYYEIPAPVASSVRIVHLSDLHSWEFGEGNGELVELVKGQEPDLILMTGDMLDMTDPGPGVVCGLIRKLAEIAPVYYGYGNHEKAWEREKGKSLAPELTEAGAVVLDCTYADIEIAGKPVRLGGYHAYYRRPHMSTDSPEQMELEESFYEAFEDTDRYKILLSHVPTAWLDWGLMDDYPVDLVLTGHYHGGQARLPFVGGVIAPYVGWFPEFTEGLYTGQQATVILSTGLGSSPGIPRVNNPPQLVVVDLVPEI